MSCSRENSIKKVVRANANCLTNDIQRCNTCVCNECVCLRTAEGTCICLIRSDSGEFRLCNNCKCYAKGNCRRQNECNCQDFGNDCCGFEKQYRTAKSYDGNSHGCTLSDTRKDINCCVDNVKKTKCSCGCNKENCCCQLSTETVRNKCGCGCKKEDGFCEFESTEQNKICCVRNIEKTRCDCGYNKVNSCEFRNPCCTGGIQNNRCGCGCNKQNCCCQMNNTEQMNVRNKCDCGCRKNNCCCEFQNSARQVTPQRSIRNKCCCDKGQDQCCCNENKNCGCENCFWIKNKDKSCCKEDYIKAFENLAPEPKATTSCKKLTSKQDNRAGCRCENLNTKCKDCHCSKNTEEKKCVCIGTEGRSCVCLCLNEQGNIIQCNDCKCEKDGRCDCKCDRVGCICIPSKGKSCICVCKSENEIVKCSDCSCDDYKGCC